MRTFLLFLHIVAVGTWLGANVTQVVASTTLGRAQGAVAAAWYRTTVTMGRVLYTPAGTLVLVTGIFLVTTSKVFQFSDFFVSVGFATVAIGIILGITVFGRQGRAAADAADAGDTSALRAAAGRIAGFGALDTLLIVFTVYAMVAKLGT